MVRLLVLICLLFWSGAALAEPARLLMLGDSLTAGYGLPPGDALPVKLQAALQADGMQVTVINAGVSGDTTAGGRSRLAWAMADKPTHAIVALGANDMLRGLDPGQAKANLDAIVSELQRQGVKVMLVGMRAQASLGAGYVTAFDGLYPALAEAHGVALYPFLLDGVAADPKLNQGDGIHPNAQGVAIIVARLKPYVEKFLKS